MNITGIGFKTLLSKKAGYTPNFGCKPVTCTVRRLDLQKKKEIGKLRFVTFTDKPKSRVKTEESEFK